MAALLTCVQIPGPTDEEFPPLKLLPSASTIGERPAESRLTLLVVDDEDGPRQSLRIVFKNDYNVVVASSGPEAIAIAQREPVHVGVLDILMQGMSGVELLRELKLINPAIEVVMLTAYETVETARQALRYGAIDYLNKPFDIPTMREAVSKAARRHRAAAGVDRSNEQLLDLQKLLQEHIVQEELTRTKGEIYASVLHDLNSPLTVISGFVELINRSMDETGRVEGEELANLKGDLRQLTSQVGRCFEISRRYLSFLHRGEERVSSRSPIRQTLRDVRDLLGKHPDALRKKLRLIEPEEDHFVAIHGTDFLQILLNLTVNALQASALEGVVTVSVSSAMPPRFANVEAGARVIVSPDFDHGLPCFALTIQDEGQGISRHLLPRLFEQSVTTKPADKGTGLGLLIVRRLVENCSGAIEVISTEGKGTRMTAYLRKA